MCILLVFLNTILVSSFSCSYIPSFDYIVLIGVKFVCNIYHSQTISTSDVSAGTAYKHHEYDVLVGQ